MRYEPLLIAGVAFSVTSWTLLTKMGSQPQQEYYSCTILGLAVASCVGNPWICPLFGHAGAGTAALGLPHAVSQEFLSTLESALGPFEGTWTVTDHRFQL